MEGLREAKGITDSGQCRRRESFLLLRNFHIINDNNWLIKFADENEIKEKFSSQSFRPCTHDNNKSRNDGRGKKFRQQYQFLLLNETYM